MFTKGQKLKLTIEVRGVRTVVVEIVIASEIGVTEELGLTPPGSGKGEFEVYVVKVVGSADVALLMRSESEWFYIDRTMPIDVAVAVIENEVKRQSPFVETDRVRELFGQWAGSEVSTKLTYVPTGKMVRISGYHNVEFLSTNGCRIFEAHEFDWMTGWMTRNAPGDLLALRRIDPTYDFAKEN